MPGATRRQRPIPDGSALAFSYQGDSMRGTFRAGDLLLVAPVGWKALRPGDVVAFRQPGVDGDGPVVAHRVVGRTAAGLLTRADCTTLRDAESIPAERLLGRVHSVQREGRLRPVYGGRAGRLRVVYLRLLGGLLQVLRMPYSLLRASGLVRRLWRPRLVQVRLATGEGPLVKYIHGRRTVACWWPEEKRFWSRKPYDLVIEPPEEPSTNRARVHECHLPDEQPDSGIRVPLVDGNAFHRR
jgi:hypothetical protein